MLTNPTFWIVLGVVGCIFGFVFSSDTAFIQSTVSIATASVLMKLETT